MSDSQRMMDANQVATVTLPLGAWNTVLGLVAKGSWEVADPVMQTMRKQLLEQTTPKEQPSRLQPVA